MNGPFFSERGICSSTSCFYSSTLRNFTHCARRNFLNPRTGPGTRCDSGQNGQTKRVPCAFGIVSTITAQLDLHRRKKTCGAGASLDPVFTTFSGFTGFAAFAAFTVFALAAASDRVRDALFLERPAWRDAERRDAFVALIALSIPRRAGFIL